MIVLSRVIFVPGCVGLEYLLITIIFFTGVVPTGCHAIICIGRTSTRIKSGLTRNDVPAGEPVRLELFTTTEHLERKTRKEFRLMIKN